MGEPTVKTLCRVDFTREIVLSSPVQDENWPQDAVALKGGDSSRVTIY